MKIKTFLLTASVSFLLLKLISYKPIKYAILTFLVDKSAQYLKKRLT